jgi:cellulose synthase/poly-beta-1,6-N-acetylglucosamine synthase-like glycosyltransferase
MRVGLNPNKDKIDSEFDFVHQVIVPVYIPNEEGYFKESFRVLQYCFDSLFKTCHHKTFFTVVNNGSSEKIKNYLDELFELGQIHEIIHTVNVGKLNAILKGISGHNFDLVTITDSDVLFCTNWQKETLNVFINFPKAGVVGITPQFKMYERFCGNVVFDTFLNPKVRFTKVVSPADLELFYNSLGWDNDYNKDYLKLNLSISANECEALVGSGHFVATYKRSVFDEIISYIPSKMGADSEMYLDKAPLYKGLWRLSTSANYAYHIGNVVEDWMEEVLMNLGNDNEVITLPVSQVKQENKWCFFVKNRIFSNIFSFKITKKLFYIYKGLPKVMFNKY